MCGWFAGTFRRDLCRTLYMFGTHHCCYSSSSCLSDTCELAPASASAERRTFIIKCAVHALRSASDVACSIVTLKDAPNQCECNAANTRRCDRTFQAYAIGCREGDVKGERVYKLPRDPGVYNNKFRSFWQHSREEESTVWAV